MGKRLVHAGDFSLELRFEEMGELAADHLVTLTSGLENPAAFGKTAPRKDAQKMRFEEA